MSFSALRSKGASSLRDQDLDVVHRSVRVHPGCNAPAVRRQQSAKTNNSRKITPAARASVVSGCRSFRAAGQAHAGSHASTLGPTPPIGESSALASQITISWMPESKEGRDCSACDRCARSSTALALRQARHDRWPKAAGRGEKTAVYIAGSPAATAGAMILQVFSQ